MDDIPFKKWKLESTKIMSTFLWSQLKHLWLTPSYWKQTSFNVAEGFEELDDVVFLSYNFVQINNFEKKDFNLFDKNFHLKMVSWVFGNVIWHKHFILSIIVLTFHQFLWLHSEPSINKIIKTHVQQTKKSESKKNCRNDVKN